MSGPPSGTRKLSSRIRSLDEELRSILNDVEMEEKEPGEQIRLEVLVERYRYKGKTTRRISISQRFNEKAEIEKYDRVTEKGARYGVATIRFLPTRLVPNQSQKF
ncbi:MAG: hypothetical protein ABSE82_15415 [Nitrososphaerales archaeon]